jgi:hypothetical protein
VSLPELEGECVDESVGELDGEELVDSELVAVLVGERELEGEPEGE